MINWERPITLGLIAIILFSPLFRAALPIWAITSVYLMVLVTLTIWLVRIREDREFSFTRTPLDLPILFFILFVSLSLIKSISLHHSICALHRLICYFLIYFLVVNNIKSNQGIRKIVLAIIGVSILVTVYGIIEFFKFSLNPPLSTFPNSNMFASFLLIPLSLCGGLFAFSKGPLRKRIILGALLFLFLSALITTRSRGGFLSLLAIIIFLGSLKSKRWALVTLAIILLLFFLLPTPSSSPLVRLITIGEKDPYAYKRIAIWKATLEIIKDHPFLGTGIGTFKKSFIKYNFPVEGFLARFGKTASFAHNEYLHIVSEAGIFVLGVFIWLLASFFRKLKRLIKSLKGREEYALLVGLCGGIIGILVHSLVDFPLHAPAIPIVLSINAGIVMGLSYPKSDVQSPKSKVTFLKSKRYYLYLVLIILILGYAIITPYLAEGYVQSGEYYRNRNPELAIEKYEKALALNFFSGDYRIGLGNIYVERFRETGKLFSRTQAYQEFKKAIELEPENGDYHQRLAKFYYRNFGGKSRLGLAIQATEKAIEKDPNNCFYYYNLATVYANEREYEEAIPNYEKAIEIEPNYVQARYNLGCIYQELGKTEDAQLEYEQMEKTRRKGLAKVGRTSYENKLITLVRRKDLTKD